MFGEDESESPRACSPWEALLAASPNTADHNVSIPKLVPEVEEGNVEYKLKLINPSPERFARLVTQLKWRLLEGGGQAYYELGVADSGLLVGLSRDDLEQSLQTLEEMAGEIGASVIVVKEIAVPIVNRGGGPWEGVLRIANTATSEDSESVTEGESTATEAELSTPDDLDLDTDTDMFIRRLARSTSFVLRSHPSRPSINSSPTLFPFDAENGTDADAELEPDPPPIDLAIASVFKPRPARKRNPIMLHPTQSICNKQDSASTSVTPSMPLKFTPGGTASRNKKQHRPVNTTPITHASAQDPSALDNTRRATRDRRRLEKKRIAKLLAAAGGDVSTGAADQDALTKKSDDALLTTMVEEDKDAAALVSGLDALHVSLDTTPQPPGIALVAAPEEVPEGEEHRLIVEALVVRKMSLEEAFLDFGGFAIQI